jgi:hypothetical protein
VSADATVTPRLPTSLLPALRRDPGHAAELGVLYAMARLAPNRDRWLGDIAGDGRESKVARRAIVQARRDGAVTGTSFVVGMPAALLSMYLNQLRVVLRIAALHGLDPTDPARAAEFLVLQGKHATVEDAAAVLAAVPVHREREHQGIWRAGLSMVREVPSLVSLQVHKARSAGWVNGALTVLGVISFVVPVLGVPVCAAGSARTTRRLTRSATKFYDEAGAPPACRAAALALPDLTTGRDWRLLVVGGLSLVAAAVATVIWIGGSHRRVAQVGLGLLWVWVAFTYARLWRLIGPRRRVPATATAG